MSVANILKEIKTLNLHKAFKEIEDYVESCEKQRDKAIAQVKEWNKDEEIQRLKTEMENREKRKAGSTIFVIEPEENAAINEWIDKHTKEKHNSSHYAGAIGGRYSYSFVPTSIGEVGEIICSCGEKFCFRELC